MADAYKKLIFISRPRIWLYTLGSFLFGVQAAYVLNYSIPWVTVGIFMLLLTVPVNLFIYALNDFFDVEADRRNPKKDSTEYRAQKQSMHLLVLSAGALFFAGAYTFLQEALVQKIFILWLIIVCTYNVPPVRLKAVPLLDMFFALNFPLWGVLGFSLVSKELPALEVLIPVCLLGAMMHLYTATADIQHDKQAGVITTAVWLGTMERCLWLCGVLVLAAATYLWHVGWYILALTVLLYVIFFGFNLLQAELREDMVKTYTYFIYLQYVVGFLASCTLFLYL